MKCQSFKLMLVLFLLALAGCASSEKSDWYDFQRTVRPMFAEHVAAVDAVRNISGANEKSDAETSHVLRQDILPRYDRIVANLESTHPKTADVQEVRQLYLSSMQKMRQAIDLMAQGVEHHDNSKVEESGRISAASQQDLQAMKAKQEELNAKYGRAPE